MVKEILIQVFELSVGVLLAFLIISNGFGRQTWIIWIAAFVFIVYKIRKEGLYL